jgi:hypothetical protein
MTQRKAAKGLDFEALQVGIERCDPDLVLGFYAEDAQLSIVNALTPHASPFELCGKAEIAKHLRATYRQEASHRVEREDIVGEDRVTFREACQYSDGGRIVVETTLEVRDGKIVRQVDVVRMNSRPGGEKGIGRSPPSGRDNPPTPLEVDAPQPDRLPRLQRPTEKEDLK